jgi:hypothetical protein
MNEPNREFTPPPEHDPEHFEHGGDNENES